MSEHDGYLRRLHEHGYHASDAPSFAAAWDELEVLYLERLGEVCDDGEWRGRMRAGAGETLRLVEARPVEARFLVVDSLLAGEAGRHRQRELRSRLAVLIDSARNELEAPDRVPPAAAPWIVSTFFDRIYRYLTGRSQAPPRTQLPELMFLATSAYFGTEDGLAELLRKP